jgi:DNA-directed RNA polymerase subunit RPC12/RpoP
MSPSPDGKQLWCQFCGTTRDDPVALQELEQAQAKRVLDSDYEPPARSFEMEDEQKRLLKLAWDCIQENDMKTAVYILEDGLKRYDSFADAWYLLSLTVTNPLKKVEYLDQALAIQPYHEYAWRDKGILEGVIPAGEGQAADQPDPTEPIVAESAVQTCAVCGGQYTQESGLLVCHHCGYKPGGPVAQRTQDYRGGYDKLDNALLQRRFGFTKEWKIGARVLACQNCGAQLTLTSEEFSTQCRFCDTAHVLIRDAVGSFEEPDALLPFQIDRETAARAVHNRLSPDLRSQVERGDLQAVYLPFWDFAHTMAVFEDFKIVPHDIRDVLVSGVQSPSQAVLYELMPYQLRALIPYDARYLATYPAQIYGLDVIQASITGWAYIKASSRYQSMFHAAPEMELARTDLTYGPDNGDFVDLDRVRIKELGYRLVLLPVWMVTLHMQDGTRRPAVVNGQTGEAIISASFVHTDTIIAGPNRPQPDLPIQPLPRRNVIRPLSG